MYKSDLFRYEVIIAAFKAHRAHKILSIYNIIITRFKHTDTHIPRESNRNRSGQTQTINSQMCLPLLRVCGAEIRTPQKNQTN